MVGVGVRVLVGVKVLLAVGVAVGGPLTMIPSSVDIGPGHVGEGDSVRTCPQVT